MFGIRTTNVLVRCSPKSPARPHAPTGRDLVLPTHDREQNDGDQIITLSAQERASLAELSKNLSYGLTIPSA